MSIASGSTDSGRFNIYGCGQTTNASIRATATTNNLYNLQNTWKHESPNWSHDDIFPINMFFCCGVSKEFKMFINIPMFRSLPFFEKKNTHPPTPPQLAIPPGSGHSPLKNYTSKTILAQQKKYLKRWSVMDHVFFLPKKDKLNKFSNPSMLEV